MRPLLIPILLDVTALAAAVWVICKATSAVMDLARRCTDGDR